MTRHGRHTLTLLFVILVSACSGAVHDAADRAEVPHRTGSQELLIGDEASGDTVTFARISGIATDSQGRIFVADVQDDVIRVFAPDGRLLFHFGRNGGGPGEFSGVCCLGIDAQGRLWARDGGNGRYDVFALRTDSAAPLFTVRMANLDQNYWAPVQFDSAGRLVDTGHSVRDSHPDLMHFHLDTAGVVRDSVRIPAVPFDSLGVKTVNLKVSGGVATRFLYPPYGPNDLVAHGPLGQYARAVSSSYRVSWFDAQGRLIRVIEQPHQEGPLLDADERARAEKQVADAAKRFSLSAGDRFAVPARKQPLAGLWFDEHGRVWVQRSTSAKLPRQANVWDRDGNLVFTAEWPAGTDLGYTSTIGDPVALAVAADSLGVQRVVRLRWR